VTTWKINFKWDQSIVDVCVTTQGQRASMLVEEPLAREVNPTRGRRTKWEKEKKVHLDVVEEQQKIQKFEDRPIKVEILPTTWKRPSCLLG